MASGSFRFDRFLLDTGDRQLKLDEVPVELNARYLDALALLVRESGRLVPKSRFLEEVWRGVPVTDEALTQCIKTLRRQLGDNAASPRFIETVPKHGYRFIAPVECADPERTDPVAIAAIPDRLALRASPRRFFLLGGAGAIGGGGAGIVGGLFYGLAVASHSLQSGSGALSVLLVITCLTGLVAMIGGAGVGFGIATAEFSSTRRGLWTVVGASCGGFLVGAVVKLLGMDTFDLLFGTSPGDITGAPEGLLLGGAVGLGAYLADCGTRSISMRRGIAVAGTVAGAAGILITFSGGKLMGRSLDLLARSFPESRLRLDEIGRLLGEDGFGPVSQIVTGGLEGMLFGSCIVGAMKLARRYLSQTG